MSDPENYADFTWTSRDGLTLHARRYGQPGGRRPVVCIPGLTRNCRDFETVAPWIAGQGRDVIAVDLRGRGKSDRSVPRRYNPRVYAEDMACLLEATGLEQAVFVGTSLGGLVTMALAARRPALIAGAVLNDVGPRVAPAGLARIRAYAGKAIDVASWGDAADYARQINGVAFPAYGDEDWMIVARRLFTEKDGRPVLDYDPDIFSPPHPLLVRLTEPLAWSAFRRLARTGPLQLVRGELTDVIDVRTVSRMQRLAPDMADAVIPGVGHAPMLDEAESRAALAEFLDRAP